MSKLTLIALAVLCSNPSGYRRAGFSLTQGENLIDANKEQFDALNADKSLTVSFVDGDLSESDIATHVKSERIMQLNNEQLHNENARLQSQVLQLTTLCSEHEQTISLLEIEVANPPKYIDESKSTDLAGVGERTFGFDCSLAPENIQRFIVAIDDLNKEAPLTKKPNCDHLTITVNEEAVTPTAAERDAAWDWYQENVKVVEVDDATSDSKTQTEA